MTDVAQNQRNKPVSKKDKKDKKSDKLEIPKDDGYDEIDRKDTIAEG